MDNAPYDVLCEIASFLPQGDLLAFSLLNKHFSNIPNEKAVWGRRTTLVVNDMDLIEKNPFLKELYDNVPIIVPRTAKKFVSFKHSYVNIPTVSGFDSCNLTYTAWVRTAEDNLTASYPGIIGTAPYKVSYHMCGPAYTGMGLNNTLSFYTVPSNRNRDGNDFALFSSKFKMREWVFTATTFDVNSGQINIYFDGTLSASNVMNPQETRSYGPIQALAIGSLLPNITLKQMHHDHYFTGNIAYVGIWNRVLSEKELSNVMVYNMYEKNGLLGLWPLNEGSGDVMQNYVQGGTNGQNIGCKWIDTVPAIAFEK